MKSLNIISLLSILFTISCFSQEKDLLRLDQFPVSRVQRNKPVRIDLISSPKARLYKTVLRENAKQGVNFAGQYRLAAWRCGLNCLSIAVIDARSGRVFFPPELPSLGFGFGIGANLGEPLQFNAKSRLLIVTGYPFWAEQENPEGGKFYYEWKNNRLKLIGQMKMGTYKETMK